MGEWGPVGGGSRFGLSSTVMQLKIKMGRFLKKELVHLENEISQIYYEVDVDKEIALDATLLNTPAKYNKIK